MTTGGGGVERGRQVERTTLSRQRTAVGVATNGALMLHLGTTSGGLGLVLGATALGAAAVLWAVSAGIRLPTGRADTWLALARRPGAAATIVLAVSIADLVLVLTS